MWRNMCGQMINRNMMNEKDQNNSVNMLIYLLDVYIKHYYSFTYFKELSRCRIVFANCARGSICPAVNWQ